MKVFIGDYPNWVGPYQIADFFQRLGISEERAQKFGDYLANTWLADFCEWLGNQQKRKMKIRIDKYDTWNMDNTLAHIILPMLIQLKANKHGVPTYLQEKDLPKALRSAPLEKGVYHSDMWEPQWNWIMDEMIHAFSCLVDDKWEEKFQSGQFDMQFAKEEGTNYSVSKYGPNHTYKCDYKGLEKEWKRIDNGLRLFGTYYRSLWD
jgi:hypothetical protein